MPGVFMKRKKFLVILVITAVLFSSCSQKYDDPADYEVESSDDGKSVKTTRYVGTKWRDISVPPRINGKRVTEIGRNTFADIEIATITIPKGIKKIGEWSFSGNFISNFEIPETVTEIETGAFMANRLSHITIPDSVKRIGYRAFCENPLKSITIGKDVILETIDGYDTSVAREWKFWAFELGLDVEFDEVYEQNGKKAGTYILQDDVWGLQEL
jgi:hypothetical protein